MQTLASYITVNPKIQFGKLSKRYKNPAEAVIEWSAKHFALPAIINTID
ncbi:MAG: hypothetical protein JWO92_905 [Chitinophagaceae bacterium]|nr:hypothetical protein [Chitinophagaceae bacterium]